jgi:hypothetical protein
MPRSTRRAPARRAGVRASVGYAGGCEKTIRNWIAAGRLTGYRVGPKLIQVDLDELDRLIRPVPTAGNGA